ncbi:MAG: outer membrane beta-barrel protein [Deltaproteobacteria bacterium]|nr:outer membrane beta-barrel protein [Deltaproteobacteria bacterium]
MKPFGFCSPWFLVLSFLLIVVTVLFATTSWAGWRFLPALELEESYDSNIYLSSDNETSDFITRLSPELRLEDVSATRTFAASYNMHLYHFDRHDENNYIGHEAELSWDQRLSRNLSWHIINTYYRSEEPLEEDPEYTGVRETRNEYSRNMLDTGFTYQFGEEDRVTVSYLDSRLQNRDPEIEDDVEYGPSLELEYWLTRRHGLLLRYSWSRMDYEHDPSDQVDEIGFGYRWRRSPHTMLHLDYGLVLFSSKAPAEAEEGDDYNVQSVSAGFDHDFGPSWALSGSFGYFFFNPKESESSDGSVYSLTLVRSFSRGSVTLSGEGGYRLDYSGADAEGFTEYRGVSLSSTYSMSPRTELYTSTSYMYEKAEEEERTRDETWNVSVGMSYEILSWLTGVVELTQRERSSSDEEDEYRDSLILLRLRGTYEWR